VNVFLELLGAWQNRGELRPTRQHYREAKRNRAPVPWNWSGERAAFRVDQQRRTAAEILRSYDRPRMVGGCQDPRCNGRCGR
jgi:hypothetical protein